MNQNKHKINRTIGVDMHPDVFTAAAVKGERADSCLVEWTHDRQPTKSIQQWAKKHLLKDDVVVLEASGNSFEIAHLLGQIGHTVLVLESQQAGKIRENYCNDDKSSAVKLAKIYLTGLAKIVWQPDPKTRLQREIFFKHRNAVKDCTIRRNRIKSYLSDHCVRLPKPCALTQEKTLEKALGMREWTSLEKQLLSNLFEELWFSEQQRKRMRKIMAVEVSQNQHMRSLLKILGINFISAYGLVAMIGDINRFMNPKKLVGYLGLSPRKTQSGNNKDGIKGGIGNKGRGDIRALLVQGAQSALNHKTNPFYLFGWKIAMRKCRNVAVGAVARKMATRVWYVLKGFAPDVQEQSNSLKVKFTKLATVIGLQTVKEMGYTSCQNFVSDMIKKLNFSEKVLE